MKPNVSRRNLHSDILGMSYRMWVSMKARRCIMKAGSLDKYLLNTKPSIIESRLGLYLRALMLNKIRNPGLHVPYVPG